MKKLIYAIPVFALCIGLLAGCGEDGEAKKPAAGNTDREYSAKVDAPEGWEQISATGTLFRYKKGSGDFWVRQSSAGLSLESDIEYYKERENTEAYTFTWGEVKDASVGGLSAKALNYTVDTGSLKMRYDAYFTKKDAALFIIVCLTAPDSDYGELESDFKAMLDSLKITEK